MADEGFDALDSLDDLDWSDIEDELAANKSQIVADAEPVAESNDAPTLAQDAIDQIVQAGTQDSDIKDHLDIDCLLDVELQIVVEVGRTNIIIERVLELDKESVVELETLVGQPLDVRVNNRLVARGETVVINDKFGIRITEIIPPEQRVSVLG